MTNDEIAEAIADALFVNGLGEQADRLVMKKRDQAHGDLGGWCHAAVRGVAGRVLEGERVVETVDTSVSTSHFATCPQAGAWRRR